MGRTVILPHILKSFIRTAQTSEFPFLFTFPSIIIASLSLFLLAWRHYSKWIHSGRREESSLIKTVNLPLFLIVILVSYSPAFTYLRHVTHSADALTDSWLTCKFIHRKEKNIFVLMFYFFYLCAIHLTDYKAIFILKSIFK